MALCSVNHAVVFARSCTNPSMFGRRSLSHASGYLLEFTSLPTVKTPANSRRSPGSNRVRPRFQPGLSYQPSMGTWANLLTSPPCVSLPIYKTGSVEHTLLTFQLPGFFERKSINRKGLFILPLRLPTPLPRLRGV